MTAPFFFLVICLVLLSPGSASATGRAEEGHRLAQQWCQQCHVTTPNATSGGDQAPTFESVAKREGTTAKSLRAWLLDPHPPMPNLGLSEQQIQDLVSYIQSLEGD